MNKQVAIITGAGHGIGRCVARMYGEKQYRVYLAEQDLLLGREAAEELTSMGIDARFIRCDVSDEGDVIAMMEAVIKESGKVDVLINNAGISKFVPFFELSGDQWDHILGVNLKGQFLCSREAAKEMKRQGGGAIVNIASTRALMSEPNGEAYGASKGGIVALTHAMAMTLGPLGIRVNCISPGWIETGDATLREEDHSQHPAGRVGEPEDIGSACLFLTDPGNGFITGQNMVIDGGMTKKMIYLE